VQSSFTGRTRPNALAAAALVWIIWAMVPGVAQAQDPEDQLGNWLIYNGTVRFSDRWTLFTEAQVRLYEVTSNVNEVFVRAAGQYDTSPNTLVALGYMRSEVQPFLVGDGTSEDRIYEQFTLRHKKGRPGFEHRFRLEQRWLGEVGETNYRNRFRYRFQITTPLNRPTLEPRTHFFNFYNELFLNFANSGDTFDQNRFYVAYGRQFTQHANLQLGLLWQARSSADFVRLQIFYTHNFDLRDR
jgi:hypothetical protein